MLQGAKKTFSKMNQDLAKTKYPDDVYYSGNNIRIVNNENNGNVVNIQGNTDRFTFPDISTEAEVETLSGQTLTKDLDYLFDGGNNTFAPNKFLGSLEINDVLYCFVSYLSGAVYALGIFSVTEVDNTYTQTLIFFDGLTYNNERFDIKGYYENESTIKLYWADGENQLRFINVANADSINLPVNFLSSVPSVILTNPVITGFELSGSHTAGTIQYAYNLYNLNGAQTKISPLSTFAYLNVNDLGNQVGDLVNKSPTVSISNLDTTYDKIRVYSIKYTSQNATPTVNIVYDRDLETTSLTITDSNTNLTPVTFDEFLFLGGYIYIPKHLIVKDNVLFLANYKTQQRDIDFDARAYSYSSGNVARLEDNVESAVSIGNPSSAVVAATFDCINPTITDQVGDTYYETYRHPYNDTTVRGGTGKNVEYKLKYNTTDINVDVRRGSNSLGEVAQPYLQTSLKTGEIYRLFLEFLLEDGSWSFPKWVADIKIPVVGEFFNSSNTNYLPITNAGAKYIYIETTLLNAPADTEVVGWRTSIVERTEEDKTVVSQGLINSTIADAVSDVDYLPSYVQRNYHTTLENTWSTSKDDEYIYPRSINYVSSAGVNYFLSNNEVTGSPSIAESQAEIVAERGDYTQSTSVFTIVTPETIYYDRLPLQTGYLRRLGFVEATESTTTRQYLDADGNPTDTILNPVTGADLSVNTNTITKTNGQIRVGTDLTFGANEQIITRASRLVGDTEDQTAGHSEESYSAKKFFFVRTYGGYEYHAEDYKEYDIQNNITFVKKEFGTQNIIYDAPIGGITYYSFASRASIAIKYDATVYSYFNYNTGTCVAVAGLGNDYGDFYGTEESSLTSSTPYGLMVEFYRTLSTQYGGNSYEAKQNNITIPYSNVVLSSAGSQVTTVHEGDTFIQKFKAVRTTKGDVASDTQITEVIDFPVETSINLDLRYDVLKYVTDNYDTEEDTSYGFNNAYNQINNTIRNFAKPTSFTELTSYTTGIIPTKTKIPGEAVDSFTDVLINDAKILDPAYGSINALFEYNSNVFSFQDKAIAYIAINPRVQISGSDGVPIELGTGNLIERYQYVTTNAGTVNKNSVVKAKNGLAFVDLYNRSISFLGGQSGTTEISTLAGMYSYLKTNIGTEFTKLKLDQLGSSVHSVYDNINEEILFTFNTATPFDKTLVYSNLAQGFTSFYDSAPDIYIPFKNEIYSTSGTGATIAEHYVGDYLDWDISLIIGNDPDYNKTFNNIHYNSNFYNGGTELNNITFTRFGLDNGYQTAIDSSFDPDSYTNVGKKRLRRWNFILPRETGTRNRFNSPWLKLELKFLKGDLPTDPTDYSAYDIKGILDDVLITYNLNKT